MNCYEEKLKLYFTVIGIWIAATVETENEKWLGEHTTGKNALFSLWSLN